MKLIFIGARKYFPRYKKNHATTEAANAEARRVQRLFAAWRIKETYGFEPSVYIY